MVNVGKGKVFIIAEAGVNHNGKLEVAKKLVDAAVDSKADAVKFQTFKAENVVVRKAEKALYQKHTTKSDETQYEMLKKLELSYEHHVELYNYCKQKGIMFLSTAFDCHGADMLQKLGVSMFKISSGEITNMPLIKHIAKKNKPIILSTGMANLGEVEEAISWIRYENDNQLILMHCTTDYPSSYEDVNLSTITTMKQAFKLPVGYSDHTIGVEVPIAAVALGAQVIEKHFTLDKNMEGPDHKASLCPEELKHLVNCIRNIEVALGDGIKRISKGEIKNLETVRRSIVAKRAVKKGQKIEEQDLDIKRPQTGILPKYYYELIGRVACRDIEVDEAIRWNDVF